MGQVPAFFIHTGVMLNSIALEFQRSGAAAATLGAIAQGEDWFFSSYFTMTTVLTRRSATKRRPRCISRPREPARRSLWI